MQTSSIKGSVSNELTSTYSFRGFFSLKSLYSKANCILVPLATLEIEQLLFGRPRFFDKSLKAHWFKILFHQNFFMEPRKRRDNSSHKRGPNTFQQHLSRPEIVQGKPRAENFEKPPCHYYHKSNGQCQHGEDCKFSHDGLPAGVCINDSCPICVKSKSSSIIGPLSTEKQNNYPKPSTNQTYFQPTFMNTTTSSAYNHLNLGNQQTFNQPRQVCYQSNAYQGQQICYQQNSYQGQPTFTQQTPIQVCIQSNIPQQPSRNQSGASTGKRDQPPCHHYHLKNGFCPSKNQCKFSHLGPPLGKCINDDCPVCAKEKEKANSTATTKPQANTMQANFQQGSMNAQIPMNYMPNQGISFSFHPNLGLQQNIPQVFTPLLQTTNVEQQRQPNIYPNKPISLKSLPCHHYHLKNGYCPNGDTCKFSHEGPPTGSCECPVCLKEKENAKLNPKNSNIKQSKSNPRGPSPCHHYHLKGSCPSGQKCTFSHAGEPAGSCIAEDCPVCAKTKDFATLTYELPMWASRIFYAIYSNKLKDSFDVDIKTLPTGIKLSFLKSKNNETELENVWNQYKKEFKEIIEKKSWAYEIPGTQVLAVLRNGLEVSDILVPGDFNRLNFVLPAKRTEEEIRTLLKLEQIEIEEITITSEQKSFNFSIKFVYHQDAANCYRYVQEKLGKEIVCLPLIIQSNQNYFSWSLISRFAVEESTGTAILRFENDLSPLEFEKRLKERKNIIDGQKVSIKIEGKNVILTGLNKHTNEHKLTLLSEVYDAVAKIELQRQEKPSKVLTFEGVPQELKNYTGRFACSMPTKSEEYALLYESEICFENKQKAKECATMLANSSFYGYLCPSVSIRARVSIPILGKIYDQIIDNLQEIIASTASLHDPKIKFDLDYQGLKQNQHKYISFYRDYSPEIDEVDLDTLEEEFVRLIEIIATIHSEPIRFLDAKGSVDTKSTDIAFSNSMTNYYRQLQYEPAFKEKLYISFFPKTRVLQIYSKEHALITEVQKRIKNRVAKLLKDDGEKVSLKETNIYQFRKELQKENLNEHLEWVHYFNADAMVILTENTQIKDRIRALLKNCPKREKKTNQDAVNECSICFLEENLYSLIHCGHQFCMGCLGDYFQNSSKETSVFLRCPQVGCGMKISPYDLQETASQEVIQKLIQRHISSFFAANRNEFVYCPTKNCPNVLKTFGGKKAAIECSVCNTTYCGRNLAVPHLAHEDELCPHMKEEFNSQGFKKLACCGVYAEKPEGCNVVNCLLCGQFTCWVCAETECFKLRDDCYKHLIEAHKGFFEVNEMDQLIKIGYKKLGCCGELAIKISGCNKVECTLCKKQNCWKCLSVFNTADECYTHLRSQHGGFF